MTRKPVQPDATATNADWLKAEAWREWPEDLDALRAWVFANGWASIEAFKATPAFAAARAARPALRDL